MRILVIGLDCAAPELLFGDENLPNIRRLMEFGTYGHLESVIPPITIPAWMCMATSQDPGSLGVYGFRNRNDYSYGDMAIVSSRSIQEIGVWDQLAREGKRSVLIGVPPSYPPRKLNGISVGCFMTPDTKNGVFTHPPETGEEIARLVGEYPVDVKGFRTEEKEWLRDQIFSMSGKQFKVLRHLMTSTDWDYLHFIDIGLDRIQHGFWEFHDENHRLHQPGNPYQNVIRDYYSHLDRQIGETLALLDEETVVLVLSDHGAQRMDGGFCVNEWLVQESLLGLNQYPDRIRSFDELEVNWEETQAWGAGGYYARIFLNVKGREPQGTIDPTDYESVRDDLKARLEATVDQDGEPLGTLVFKPEELYRDVRSIAPDLIVHIGALSWRSIGSVGHSTVHVERNDTGPDGCNHSQFGAFVLASPKHPAMGEIQGVHLLDMAPTLLALGGYDIPASMQGSPIGSDQRASSIDRQGMTEDEERILRERLKGLGYIS